MYERLGLVTCGFIGMIPEMVSVPPDFVTGIGFVSFVPNYAVNYILSG